MNCANHPDRERTAFCQNCGKPLCNDCVRNVGTSIFCEPCLTARVAGPPPTAGYGYPPGAAGYPPIVPPAGTGVPNPALAGLLGLIPGVGAMYNEQYAKGIVHLMVFAVLVSLAHDVGIFDLFVAGWIFYMVIEAYHTARARRDGTPLPNPFGLNELGERLGFGRSWPGTHTSHPFSSAPGVPDPPRPAGGAYFHQAPDGSQTYSAPGGAYFHQAADGSQTYAAPGANPYGVPPIPPMPPVPPPFDPELHRYRRFPAGAIWLIGLGLLFMLGNTSVFHIFHGRLFVPFLLIGIGVWLFVRRMTSTGQGLENDGTPLYHYRLMSAVSGAFWVILVGVIWLLDELHILTWGNSWPLFLIGAGLMMFFRRTMHPGYGYGYPPPPAPTAPPPAAPPVTTTSLVPRDPSLDRPADDQEGR